MFIVWVVFHVLVCVALVLVVLMQSSKGEGLAGSAFGGGGLGGAVFGGRGAASFLSKSTSYLAVIFMLNCGALAFMSSSTSRRAASGPGDEPGTSVVTQQAQREMEQARQQQQQGLLDDSTAPFQVVPTDQAPPAPGDTAGQ